MALLLACGPPPTFLCVIDSVCGLLCPPPPPPPPPWDSVLLPAGLTLPNARFTWEWGDPLCGEGVFTVYVLVVEALFDDDDDELAADWWL